jgi:hypothetical protein
MFFVIQFIAALLPPYAVADIGHFSMSPTLPTVLETIKITKLAYVRYGESGELWSKCNLLGTNLEIDTPLLLAAEIKGYVA